MENFQLQLIELSNERQQSSFTAEVRAKPQHHKFLIGKNGASIKEIRDQTGARIIFPGNNDEDKEVITIIGKEENVLAAKAQLEAIIKNNGEFSFLFVQKTSFFFFLKKKKEIKYGFCFYFRFK